MSIFKRAVARELLKQIVQRNVQDFVDIIYNGNVIDFLEDRPELANEWLKNYPHDQCQSVARAEGFNSCEQMIKQSEEPLVSVVHYFYNDCDWDFVVKNDELITNHIFKHINDCINSETISQLEAWCLENENNLEKCLEDLVWIGENDVAMKLLNKYVETF